MNNMNSSMKELLHKKKNYVLLIQKYRRSKRNPKQNYYRIKTFFLKKFTNKFNKKIENLNLLPYKMGLNDLLINHRMRINYDSFLKSNYFNKLGCIVYLLKKNFFLESKFYHLFKTRSNIFLNSDWYNLNVIKKHTFNILSRRVYAKRFNRKRYRLRRGHGSWKIKLDYKLSNYFYGRFHKKDYKYLSPNILVDLFHLKHFSFSSKFIKKKYKDNFFFKKQNLILNKTQYLGLSCLKYYNYYRLNVFYDPFSFVLHLRRSQILKYSLSLSEKKKAGLKVFWYQRRTLNYLFNSKFSGVIGLNGLLYSPLVIWCLNYKINQQRLKKIRRFTRNIFRMKLKRFLLKFKKGLFFYSKFSPKTKKFILGYIVSLVCLKRYFRRTFYKYKKFRKLFLHRSERRIIKRDKQKDCVDKVVLLFNNSKFKKTWIRSLIFFFLSFYNYLLKIIGNSFKTNLLYKGKTFWFLHEKISFYQILFKNRLSLLLKLKNLSNNFVFFSVRFRIFFVIFLLNQCLTVLNYFYLILKCNYNILRKFRFFNFILYYYYDFGSSLKFKTKLFYLLKFLNFSYLLKSSYLNQQNFVHFFNLSEFNEKLNVVNFEKYADNEHIDYFRENNMFYYVKNLFCKKNKFLNIFFYSFYVKENLNIFAESKFIYEYFETHLKDLRLKKGIYFTVKLYSSLNKFYKNKAKIFIKNYNFLGNFVSNLKIFKSFQNNILSGNSTIFYNYNSISIKFLIFLKFCQFTNNFVIKQKLFMNHSYLKVLLFFYNKANCVLKNSIIKDLSNFNKIILIIFNYYLVEKFSEIEKEEYHIKYKHRVMFYQDKVYYTKNNFIFKNK